MVSQHQNIAVTDYVFDYVLNFNDDCCITHFRPMVLLANLDHIHRCWATYSPGNNYVSTMNHELTINQLSISHQSTINQASVNHQSTINKLLYNH